MGEAYRDIDATQERTIQQIMARMQAAIRTLDPNLQEEAEGELGLRLTQAVRKYDGRAPLENYLARVAVNTMREVRRAMGRGGGSLSLSRLLDVTSLDALQETAPHLVEIPVEGPAEAVECSLFVESLPDRLRMVVDLRLADLSAREIADRLGVSATTVSNLLGKVRQRAAYHGIAVGE